MAGGTGTSSSSDDWRIKSGEKIWRLIPSSWHQSDPNIPGSAPQVQEQAFSGDVSVLRTIKVSTSLVDSVLNGKFSDWGILELAADEVRAEGFVFEYEAQAGTWQNDAHFLLRR